MTALGEFGDRVTVCQECDRSSPFAKILRENHRTQPFPKFIEFLNVVVTTENNHVLYQILIP